MATIERRANTDQDERTTAGGRRIGVLLVSLVPLQRVADGRKWLQSLKQSERYRVNRIHSKVVGS
jgi:hypothetical protein